MSLKIEKQKLRQIKEKSRRKKTKPQLGVKENKQNY